MKLGITKIIETSGAVLLGLFVYAVIYPRILPPSSSGINVQAIAWDAGIVSLVVLVIQPWLRLLKILAWLILCGLLAMVLA